jgi:hypothetical protein
MCDEADNIVEIYRKLIIWLAQQRSEAGVTGETGETRWESDLAASRHSRPYRASRSMDADAVLASHSSGELRKEFPCEVAGIGSVADILAAKIVVEDSAVGCFVDV